MGNLENLIMRVGNLLALPKVTVTDVIEILIISFLLYQVLLFVKKTRAWNLLKGIGVVVVFISIAALFKMETILWLGEKTLNVGIIAIVVVFQPELRQALERLGRKNFITSIFNIDTIKLGEKRFSDKTKNEIAKAVFEMAKVKTGALIVVEKDTQLDEFVRTGIEIDSAISSQLLLNIFEHNTPLHDGAIIVREDRIVSATCYLPLSDNLEISKSLGTRHRAALGVSEVSDSITIVVSEETGMVSIAEDGILYGKIDMESLKAKLSSFQSRVVDENRRKKRMILKGRSWNAEKTDK
ncbi:diadenylate cyclase [Acetitomaculum ruminis DSM 5522]|uniref:Diadenylate cyclase n=1 Tax=Acetitomaculum ruminis DSM 5522 TaxID=1120918 RepID=A0A1I0YIF3_9FIRM|nr:diadenylate cyclase CdaA [Acetitomaculum ruminis]SFB13114.1 diadenylate cyclase [Acetitomaculum ruminis DSM 5522]